MIDLGTIEDIEDWDGESAHVHGFDPLTGNWIWAWVSRERLAEERPDILASLEPELEDA